MDSSYDASEITSNIRVLVRVRPLLPNETSHSQNLLECDADGKSILVRQETNGDRIRERNFNFDQVLDENVSQEDVFNRGKVAEIVDNVINGYDATIFAYGQTGSGKTFTMEGYDYQASNVEDPQVDIEKTNESKLGLVPRIASYLFNRINSLGDEQQLRVECSYIQIYNEKIFDLLNPGHLQSGELNPSSSKKRSRSQKIRATEEIPGLKLRYDRNGNKFYVENVYNASCNSEEELLSFFRRGVRAKVMGSHKLNAASSRSHCMLCINVFGSEDTGPGGIRVASRLSLVDLAGSERVRMTGATGKTLKEANAINQSLFVLRKVIVAVSAAQESKTETHVPYRDSKLTSLLQHSIGGNSLTLMIACIAPSDAYADENLSTLAYASRANRIRATLTRNEDARSKLIRKLKQEIALLKAQLSSAHAVSTMSFQQQSFQWEALATSSSSGKHLNATAFDQMKQQLLSSVEVAKSMHRIEQELRSRMESAEASIAIFQRENLRLLNENQMIREREQILLHLLDPIEGEEENVVTKEILKLRNENSKLRDDIEAQKLELEAALTRRSESSLKAPSSPARRKALSVHTPPINNHRGSHQSKGMSAHNLKQLLSSGGSGPISGATVLPSVKRTPKSNKNTRTSGQVRDNNTSNLTPKSGATKRAALNTGLDLTRLSGLLEAKANIRSNNDHQ